MRKILVLILLAGCQAAPEPVKVSTAHETNDRVLWLMLAPYVKKHFKTDMGVKEIAAELSYQSYLLTKDKEAKE